MQEQARAIGVFDHPTAKGDGREDLLRRFLADRIGTTFGVCKAEVVDSRGGTSGELDAVIYDQSVASSLTVLGERRIVRVESVVATVEIKSDFGASTWNQEYLRVRNGIGSLHRYYRAGPLLGALCRTAPSEIGGPTEAMLRNGLSTLDHFEDIPAVVSAYFGYDGPKEEESVKSFVETPLLDAVCVLGRYTVAKRRVGFNKRANGTDDARGLVWGRGDEALGAFLQVIETALASVLDARTLVLPATRYFAAPGDERTSATSEAEASRSVGSAAIVDP
jgi:hypothetical protein